MESPSDPPSGRACVLAGLQELQGCISLYGLVPFKLSKQILSSIVDKQA